MTKLELKKWYSETFDLEEIGFEGEIWTVSEGIDKMLEFLVEKADSSPQDAEKLRSLGGAILALQKFFIDTRLH